jgi:hypothetical protein
MLWPPSGERWAVLLPAETTLTASTQVSVLFVGDTHFGESYGEDSSKPSAVARLGYDYPLRGVRALARSANLVVVNLETPLTRRTHSPLRFLKPWVHWGDPERSADALRSLGVRAASLANNHALDALSPGLVDTRAALTARGIAAFGAGSTVSGAARPYRADLTVGRHRLRLAVLGAFERNWGDWLGGAYATSTASGTYPLAERTLAPQIRALKRADPGIFIVVFPHWGENYRWRTPAQSEVGRRLLDAGANIVLGHGAHLFQEIEVHQGRLICHGLGNFVFLSPGRYAGRRMHPYSLAARLDFTPRAEGIALRIVLYFLASDNQKTHYQPHLLGGAQFERASRLLLLEGGTLPEKLREKLRQRVRRGQDAVGEYLELELGTLPSTSG